MKLKQRATLFILILLLAFTTTPVQTILAQNHSLPVLDYPDALKPRPHTFSDLVQKKVPPTYGDAKIDLSISPHNSPHLTCIAESDPSISADDFAHKLGSAIAEQQVVPEERLNNSLVVMDASRKLAHEGHTPDLFEGSTKLGSPSSPGLLKITGGFWSYISEDALPSPGTQRNDEMQPTVWAAVYVYDGNDNLLGSDITGPKDSIEEGRFEISVENPGSTGFYIKKKPHTTACRVTRVDGTDYYSVAPASGLFYPDPTDTVYDVGDWVIPDSWEYKGAWRIYETIAQDHYDRGAWDFMVNEGPGFVPPEIQVHFPSDHNTHIHLEPGVICINNEDYTKALDIVQHEYGHWVMYNAYDQYFPPNAGGTHYINLRSNQTI